MAQSTRRTVQWVTLTTLLAAAGAGVYRFTSGSGTWFSTFLDGGAPVAELIAEDGDATPQAALSQSELDAVASAWGGSTPRRSEPRVAAERHPRVDDDQVRPARFAETSDATNEAVTHADDRYAAYESAAAMLPTANPQAVTRGQEPNDRSDASDEKLESSASDEEPAYGPSSQRARDAFRDIAPVADDRYGGSASGAAPENSGPLDARPAGNPFASPPASTRVPAASGGPTSLPLSAAQQSADSFSAELENEYSQPAPLRTAAAANSGAPQDIGTNQQPQSFESRPSASAGGSPYALPGGSSPSTTDGTGRPGERSLEGPQKPALVIQKFAPPEIQVGKPATFRVQVRNVGGQTADEVVIRDEVPHGTRLVSTTPRAETDGSRVVWQLGALSTGEERTLEMELMPTTEGEIGSVANVSYAARASAKTRCTMPQLAIRMTAPSSVMIGDQQRVKIELRNPGTGDATGVMLFENVPENVKHAAGPTLEFEIGTLRPGETRELELLLTAEKAGHVVNTLSARADGSLQVQQQIEFEVIAPELLVGVDGPERRYLERPATYQVSIENPGTAPAHDIELVTKLPKGMRFVRANNMGEYDAGTHAVYWSLAELPEGERGTVELTAMPVEPGEQLLEVQGKARQGLADETKHEVLVEGLAAIMFEVRDSEDPIEVGRETAYEIRVVNQGTKAASNVQVVVSLPPGMQAVSATGETPYAIKAGGVVFEPLAQLAPKADSNYRVQVKGLQPGDQRVTVQVNTDDISQPIRREESTRVFGDE
jgi:uncharacterized repeat protein (TIGR01451 family)